MSDETKSDAAILDVVIETNRVERAKLHQQVLQLDNACGVLMRQRWPHKCCRCWPNMVAKDGVCGCCDYNHVTGTRPSSEDSDYDNAT